jgi:hypothetical protein
MGQIHVALTDRFIPICAKTATVAAGELHGEPLKFDDVPQVTK